MFAAIQGHLQWFRYLGVHDLESPRLQPSPIAWARRFCDDWQDAANSAACGPRATPLTAAANAFTTGIACRDVSTVPGEVNFPTFTLRHPGSVQTRTLQMTGMIEWREFHTARASPNAENMGRLLDAVDCDLAALEFGCSPLQSLSEIVLALEWLLDVASTPEEARIWANGAQVLFQLSVAHDCDTQIDLAWAEKFRAEDAKEPWACVRGGIELTVGYAYVVILKRVASELRTVLQGSYSDALDVADDVGDALEEVWRGVMGGVSVNVASVAYGDGQSRG